MSHGRGHEPKPAARTRGGPSRGSTLITAERFRNTARMAYDSELADRLRDLLAAEPNGVEKKMFGGLAFLLAGHMAVACSRDGLMVRVEPSRTQALLADPAARPMVMRGRELTGWLRVELDAAASDAELSRWLDHGVDYVRSLPPK